MQIWVQIAQRSTKGHPGVNRGETSILGLHHTKIEPKTAASFRVLIRPFRLPATVITCPPKGHIMSSIVPLNFITLAFLFPIGGGGGGSLILPNFVFWLRWEISSKIELFRTCLLFAVLLNLMTNHSYAQVSIGCNT